MSHAHDDLRRFCARYGVDFACLSQERPAHSYAIENAPAGWDGQISALRLIAVGRFGDRVWQVLNIVLVARHFGVRQIWFDDVSEMGAFPPSIEGMAFGQTPARYSQPTLAGIFFTTAGFDAVLEPVAGDYADDTVRRFVVPFFGRALAAALPLGREVLAMYFAGGPVFPEPGTPVAGQYVMPPAGFYLRAAEQARAEEAVREVVLVHEDERNPALAAVETGLRLRGFSVRRHSGDAAAALLGARLLVAPFGTPCEGGALLSHTLRGLFSFRQVESHMYLQSRPYSLLQAVLEARGVRCRVGIDTQPGFIPPLGWDGSVHQRALLLSYPEADIALRDATPVVLPEASPREVALAAARAEAAWLRTPLPPHDDDTTDLLDFGQAMAALQQPNGRARLEAFLATHFVADPNIGLLSRWLEAALDPAAPLPDAPTGDTVGLRLWSNLARLRAMRQGGAARRIVTLGPDDDFLAESCDPAQWRLLLWLTLLAMRQIVPRQQVAAMLMARDEGINLLEWIAHHRAIGVQRIFVYTNDNADGSDALLDTLAAHDVITLIRHQSAPGVNVQRKALQHALLCLPELRDYAWVLFVDADEFTIPAARHDHQIGRLLAAAEAARPSAGAILLPWQWRLWPHRFERGPGMTLAQFPHAKPHVLFKAAVRLAACVSMCQVHTPLLDAGVPLLDSALAEVAPEQIWAEEPKSSAGGWIEHFWAKSFVEFSVKKLRGDALAIPSGEFRRDFALFADWNSPMTPETLNPVPPEMIGRTRAALDQLRAIPAIAAAADVVETAFAQHTSKVSPTLRPLFDALPHGAA